MSPNELFGNSSFWDITKVFQEWSILKVYIHAVTERVMCFANKGVLVHSEWVFGVASTALEALECHESHVLSESEGAERVFNLPLLSHQLVSRDLSCCLPNCFHFILSSFVKVKIDY